MKIGWERPPRTGAQLSTLGFGNQFKYGLGSLRRNPIYLEFCMSGGEMTAGILQKFAFSVVTSQTLDHRQKTDGRGQRGDRGQVSRLMLKCCDIAEELSETVITVAKGREGRALNHAATLHSRLSPPFMFTVTLVLCSSFLTWQFVKLGGSAKLKTFADRNPQTNHPDRQLSRWYRGCLGGRNRIGCSKFPNSPDIRGKKLYQHL